MLLGQPVRQIAFCVKDVKRAAERHSKLFGSGPFFLVEDFTSDCIYRGKQSKVRNDAAFGQWGAMQLELFEQRDDSPSVVTEFFPDPDNRVGLHHFGIFGNSLEGAKREMMDQGFSLAMEWSLPGISKTCGAFMDTVDVYGHFTELFDPIPELIKIWKMIADAAVGFDGSRPIRELAFPEA